MFQVYDVSKVRLFFDGTNLIFLCESFLQEISSFYILSLGLYGQEFIKIDVVLGAEMSVNCLFLRTFVNATNTLL